MKIQFLLVLFLSSLLSCRKEGRIYSPSTTSASSIVSFKFSRAINTKLQSDVVADIEDTTISCTLPLGVTPDSLIATFETNLLVSSVSVDSVIQKSGSSVNNYTHTLHYTLIGSDHLAKTYLVKVNVFTGLPVVYLTTAHDSSVSSKDDYINGKISINGNYTGLSSLSVADMQIKVHGNYTAVLAKKSYKIKFLSKASIFGLPADKEWLLLANYDDKTLMRNDVAFEASRIFGMPYTPHSQFCELYINGNYQGNYQLTEQIKISAGRVNIKEMGADDTSETKITGGYLLEVDQRDDGDVVFVTNRGVHIVVHDPDLGAAAQTNYIKNYMQQLEDAIYADYFADAGKGYSKYLNAETAIDWFWVNELFKNKDSKFGSSVWMYKDRNSTLNFGPAWDFDIGGGNTFEGGCDNPEGWYLKDAPWFAGLFRDPAFVKEAAAKWTSVRKQVDSLSSYIDQKKFKLKYSEARNFEKWDILKTYVYPNSEVAGSYEGEVTFLKSWLSKRIKWIDENLQTLHN